MRPSFNFAQLSPKTGQNSSAAMLDINLYRTEKGGNPEAVRESQRRRFADVSLVDKVIELDAEWRQGACRT
jgi:hypothetical protein